jgi:hypothetical protein
MHNYIGGHSKVFLFIPEGEVWVSDQVPPEERDKVCLHELTEYKSMKDGMNYAEAHILALKTENDITEAEIKEREYVNPEEVKEKLNQTYSKNDNGTWQMDIKVIRYDDIAGIIYVNDGDKIVEQLLVRSMNDLNTFIEKLDKEFQKLKE